MNWMNQIDQKSTIFLVEYATKHPWLHFTFTTLTRLSYFILILYLMICLFYGITKKYSKLVESTYLCGLSILIGTLLSLILKQIISRERPFIRMDFTPLVSHAATYSLPSTHSSILFAVAWMAARKMRWGHGLFFILFAAGAGFSRIISGLHYPSDVIAGFIVGIIAAETIIALSRRISFPPSLLDPLQLFRTNKTNRM